MEADGEQVGIATASVSHAIACACTMLYTCRMSPGGEPAPGNRSARRSAHLVRGLFAVKAGLHRACLSSCLVSCLIESIRQRHTRPTWFVAIGAPAPPDLALIPQKEHS